jgi:hypothetical protein
MRRVILGLFRATILAVCFGLPAAGQTAETPLHIRQWLGVGNWANLAPDRQVVASGDLAFEGCMTMGRLWTVVGARQDGFVDLNVLGPTGNETALAHVYLFSEETKEYRLLLGCDDTAVVFLNGKKAGEAKSSGSWKADQETLKITLAKGWNRLLVRVWSESGQFGFSARLTLPDGRPVALKTSTDVPKDLAEDRQLKRQLRAEDVSELLELLEARVNSTAFQAGRLVRSWDEEGPALDRGYETARARARSYVETLRQVLEALPAAKDEKAEAARRQRAEAARNALLSAAEAGPRQLVDRTQAFLDQARRAERLWDMVRFAAITAYEAGRQAADVDQTLVTARSLLTAVAAEYLRSPLLDERILANRTAEFTLRLIDRETGRPLDEAEVTAEQLGHEFAFGGNLFAWGQFPDPEDERRYREQFARLFNTAVVPMYWSLIEPVEGQADYTRDRHGLPGPELIIHWCRSQGLRVEASPIVAAGLYPPWLADKSPEDTRRLVEAHLRETVDRFRGQVNVWEPGSEAAPSFTINRQKLLVSQMVSWVRDADGQAEVHLSHSAPHALLTAWQAHGKEPFGLTGVQWNVRQARGAMSMADFESQLDRFRSYKCPVWLNRVMIPGPARSEQLQAEQVEMFYRTAFAHPMVRGITWWDLSDRFAQAGAPGGLLRADLSPKPAYHVLDRLINKQWRTPARGTADERGSFTFRAYFGRYRLRISPADGNPPAVWDLDLSSDGPRTLELTYPPAENE